MSSFRQHWLVRAVTTLLAVLMVASTAPVAWAASHREAPLIALDPAADLTDVYLFRSWVNPDNVVMIMNVIPGQEPSSGPNYFNFDDAVVYAFNLDTNGDGSAEDIVIEVRFTTEIQGVVSETPPGLGLPVAYAAVPPITDLDGPNSAGLGVRQRYTVKKIQGGVTTDLGLGTMFAVPSNVGPLTMPNYEALAALGIYNLSGGGRVLAGQRDETFYIDLGAVFDTVNLRQEPPILKDREDERDDRNPFGVDSFSGFNINTIAIELPISAITDKPDSVIGLYASTSRQQTKTFDPATGTSSGSGPFLQVARMANPLVNELIIATGKKDLWNARDPEEELGVDLGSRETFLTTNYPVRLTEQFRSVQPEPQDPGAAVYFTLKGEPKCMACDAWTGRQRGGDRRPHQRPPGDRPPRVSTLEEIFRAYTVLPERTPTDWPSVLGVERRTATRDLIEAAYRRLAKVAHPDLTGGEHDQMARLNAARDAALSDLPWINRP
jgi:hypothetical protein